MILKQKSRNIRRYIFKRKRDYIKLTAKNNATNQQATPITSASTPNGVNAV